MYTHSQKQHKMRAVRQLLGGAAFALGLMVSLLATAAPAAFAQQNAPASAPKFGSVDIDQVVAESNARKKEIGDRNVFIRNLNGVMQRLQTGSARFLNEAEMKELAGLYEKETPTDAEKKRIAGLESLAEQRGSQLVSLQNTANLNDTQRKQLTDLTESQQRGEQSMKAVADGLRERLEQRDVQNINKILLDIKGVIGKVAQEKGLTVVFDSKVAVYTANDITADVVKQLNK